MKNLLLAISMAAIILAGVLAGCFATNAILGENPFQLVYRWRAEDAEKLSGEDSGSDNNQNPDTEEETDGNSKENDAEPPTEKEQVPDDVKSDGTQGEKENAEKNNDTSYKIGETWTVEGQWSFTINGVQESDYRNEFSEKTPAALYIVDYSYTNIGYDQDPDGIFFSVDDTIVDSSGIMGYRYPGNIEKYAQSAPIGATCNAQECIAVDNPGDFKLYISLYDNAGTRQSAVFNVAVGS